MNNVKPMSIQETPVQQFNQQATTIVPHSRVTPVRTLATNKYYSQFTRTPAYGHAHATATFAIQSYKRPHTLYVGPSTAEYAP